MSCGANRGLAHNQALLPYRCNATLSPTGRLRLARCNGGRAAHPWAGQDGMSDRFSRPRSMTTPGWPTVRSSVDGHDYTVAGFRPRANNSFTLCAFNIRWIRLPLHGFRRSAGRGDP